MAIHVSLLLGCTREAQPNEATGTANVPLRILKRIPWSVACHLARLFEARLNWLAEGSVEEGLWHHAFTHALPPQASYPN